jgi:hypothetical protein
MSHAPVERTISKKSWRVDVVDQHSTVIDFVKRWHYAKGGPNTSTYRHGLYSVNGEREWGVTLWLPPTKIAAQSVAHDDWKGVLCLSRLAVHPLAPKNAASFLLGASMRMINRDRWPVLLTYADTRLGHTGAIYKATNWECLGEVKAGDVWIAPDGSQAGRKRGKFSYTRDQMIDMGYVKAPSAPKIKYVHRA